MTQHRQSILALILVTLTIAIASPPAHGDGDIVVAAQETPAVVSPRAAGLRLVNLPALKFALRAAYKCKGDPVSVTLSIADTYATLARDALSERRAAEAVLEVPPSQLALTASDRFCVVDHPETADELLVPGFATAHASLRCSGRDGDSVHFASAPLQVRLLCAREAEPDQPAGASEER